MKSRVIFVLLSFLALSSLSAGWRQGSSCGSKGLKIPVGTCQKAGDRCPRYCYMPYTKYVCEVCKVPECTYLPEEKWQRGTKYVPRYYEQQFVKYVPQYYTQKILRYEPVDTFSKYYTFNKCVKYNRHVNWVPKTCYKKCKYYPEEMNCCSDGSDADCISYRDSMK